MRPSVEAVDAILGQEFPVLDRGFIRVVDYMGDDTAVVQAARASYGAGTKSVSDDRGLINYLMRHRHTTPFEMCEIKLHVKLPIFVARQWIRHRTACLAGDVPLNFDLPAARKTGKARAYPLTVSEVYERFRPTLNTSRPDRQRYPFRKRDRVKSMMLRSCDERDITPRHTRIAEIWQTGVKPIMRVEFARGGVLRASRDHLCLTDQGWLRLVDAIDRGAKFARYCRDSWVVSVDPEFSQEELEAERWKAVSGYSGYEISDLGRARSWRNTRGRPLIDPVIKSASTSAAGYAVVSLSNEGVSRAKLVHTLVMEAFSPPQESKETRHLDNNRKNNRLSNLAAGSTKENAADRMASGCDQRLTIMFETPSGWRDDGEEMTYDLSVEGPFHNFSAADTIVHNSVNEVSARYSILDREFYLPDAAQIAAQSSINKQGRDEPVDPVVAAAVRDALIADADAAFDSYDYYAGAGIARELARIGLPLSTYTQWYWKVDLHNLLHFLSLRADPHAQHEIRVYAEVMLDLVLRWCPLVHAAFLEHRLNAATFSATGLSVIRRLIAGELVEQASSGLPKREWDDLAAVLRLNREMAS